jgi:enoyl-CoA hydratase
MGDIVIKEQIDNVTLIKLNRPDSLNALNFELLSSLVDALEQYDRDPQAYAAVITGSDRAFAAGADIKAMAESDMVSEIKQRRFELWQRIADVSKPIIAAVNGYALGGGCELALMCDLVIAGDNAVFGQPEINLGIIPGAGGTQRWARAAGKYVAMALVLTGRFISARHAHRLGIVHKVVPYQRTVSVAVRLASEIATKPPLATYFAKRAVLMADQLPLDRGLEFERNAFYMLFGTEDRVEGMRAFIEKRKPSFKGK